MWHAYFDVARIDARPGETSRRWLDFRLARMPRCGQEMGVSVAGAGVYRLAGYFLLPILLKAKAALKTQMSEIVVETRARGEGSGFAYRVSQIERTFAALCAWLFFQAIFTAHCEWLSPLSCQGTHNRIRIWIKSSPPPPHTHTQRHNLHSSKCK